jgi:outer membrane protein TolC
VRKLEREAAAECARIGIAVADLLPHIYINGSFGYNAQNNLAMFTPPSFYGSTGPGFSWNILNYGRLINQVKLQDAKFQACIARYQEAVKNMIASVDAIRKASELVLVQYRAGTTDFNRVSLVQEKRINRELELAQYQQVQARGLVKTYRALGGGWQIRLDGCAEGEKLNETKPQQQLPTPKILTPLDPNPEKR